MSKLFKELKQGLEEIAAYRKGKITLRSERIEIPSPLTLSLEAGLAFLNALENPPEPNQRLKEAMLRHSKNVKK
jgi:uncharacterized protein (DUF1778 family)